MDKILMKHNDVNTCGVVIYATTEEEKALYIDKECTVEATYQEVKDAYLKGCVVVYPEMGSEFNFYGKLVAMYDVTNGPYEYGDRYYYGLEVVATKPEIVSGVLTGANNVSFMVDTNVYK